MPVGFLEGVVVGPGRLAAWERHGDAASGAREGEVGPDARTGPLYVDAAGHIDGGTVVFFSLRPCDVSNRSQANSGMISGAAPPNGALRDAALGELELQGSDHE